MMDSEKKCSGIRQKSGSSFEGQEFWRIPLQKVMTSVVIRG